MITQDKIWGFVEEIYSQAVSDRRYLHQNPELSFKEFNTMEFICKRLNNLNIQYISGIAGTGVLAEIKGNKAEVGKCILIRADMDALPMQEKTDRTYKSKIPNIMHACGHDAHTAILLNACEVLYKLRDNFAGTIKFAFQPGEETSGGAEPMIAEDILEKPDVDACIALHIDPDLTTGKIRIKEGSMYASPDDFSIKIKGRGAHGAEPQNAVDPILIAAHIIVQLQSIISRNLDPFEEAVITVGSIHAGETSNIISDTAQLLGTARSFTNETRVLLEERIESVVKNVCECFGAEYEYEFIKLFPPLINNSQISRYILNSGKRCLGEKNCIWGGLPTMAGEDFAYFAQNTPSALFKLGCRNEEKGIVAPIHSAVFDIDEECLKYGIAMFVDFSLHFLNQ